MDLAFLQSDSAQMLPLKSCPPETLTQGAFSVQSDSYQAGVLLWELFSGPWPLFSSWIRIHSFIDTINQVQQLFSGPWYRGAVAPWHRGTAY